MTQTNAVPPDEDATATPGKKPVDKFIDGPVHVSIWQHGDDVKHAYRVASMQLRYQNKNRQWQTSQSYGSTDLKHLESAAKEARTRIEKWKQDKFDAPFA